MPLENKDPLVEFERFLRDKTPTEIANLLAEYVLESNHQNWDGWNRRYLTGVRALFTDIMLYANMDPEHLKKKTPPFTGSHFAYKKD